MYQVLSYTVSCRSRFTCINLQGLLIRKYLTMYTDSLMRCRASNKLQKHGLIHSANFLIDFGFVCSKSDPSLFKNNIDNKIMVLLGYVDYISLTGSEMDLLQALVHSLSQRFSMKDMGMPKYFLGIEMETHSESIFFHQHAYIKEILHVASMGDCNPMPIPLPQRVESLDSRANILQKSRREASVPGYS